MQGVDYGRRMRVALKGSLKNKKKRRGGCDVDLSGAAVQLILNIERERKKTKKRFCRGWGSESGGGGVAVQARLRATHIDFQP